MSEYSFSPTGEKFQLPTPEDYLKEFERLKKVVAEQRVLGREIVVVIGLGFVGAVMAAIVADAQDEKGDPSKFVIGMQRPSTRSYWKIPLLDRGLSPVSAEDPEVALMIDRCVNKKKTLTATYTYDAHRLRCMSDEIWGANNGKALPYLVNLLSLSQEDDDIAILRHLDAPTLRQQTLWSLRSWVKCNRQTGAGRLLSL